MKRKSICFLTISGNPKFLGGYSLYHKNLIRYIQEHKFAIDISWVYFGKENKTYVEKGIKYIEIKTNKLISFLLFGKNILLAKFLKENYFDIINFIGGPWSYLYRKKKGQKIIQTFHGTIYYFNKNQLKRFPLIQRILLFPILPLSWIQERPHKQTDKVICVSEKVKRHAKKLYGFDEKIMKVIKTGVDLREFKPRNKKILYKKLNLDKNKTYGLYVGGGGYWTKGLDRAINLGREIHNLNKNFRLIVIGSDYKKVKHLLGESFVIFLKDIPREKMPLYYSISDIFFCLSRYDGGAPTLVVSEAMASGCLLVCSKDSEQEIIKNKENGLIIENFKKNEAKEISKILNNKKQKEKIKIKAKNTIKEFSLENWGEKTIKELIK